MPAVVFDLDGTLVDSDRIVLDSFRSALAPYGVEATPQHLEAIRSRHPHRIFEDLLPPERWQEAFDRLVAYGQSHIRDIRAYAGISELLTKLNEQKIRVALWTGRDVKSACEILQTNGLLGYFECTVGGCMVTNNKPDPEGFYLVSQQLGLSPAQLLMVGDHLHDLEPAKRAGGTFVGALWNGKSSSYFADTRADQTFQKVSDFSSWLDQFLAGEETHAF